MGARIKATSESNLITALHTKRKINVVMNKFNIYHLTHLYHCNIAPVIAIPPGTWKDMRPKIFILSPVSG